MATAALKDCMGCKNSVGGSRGQGGSPHSLSSLYIVYKQASIKICSANSYMLHKYDE